MEPRSDERVVRDLFAAVTARDVSAALQLVDHDAFELDAPTGAVARGGEPYRGADGLRDYFHDLDRVWTDLEITPQELISDRPGRVIALGRVWAQARDRMIRDSPTAWVFELRDGRVMRAMVFPSAAAALGALGGPDRA